MQGSNTANDTEWARLVPPVHTSGARPDLIPVHDLIDLGYEAARNASAIARLMQITLYKINEDGIPETPAGKVLISQDLASVAVAAELVSTILEEALDHASEAQREIRGIQ